MTYLDEGVQRLPVEPLEVGPDVHHVNLCPGNHHSDKGVIIGAQALKKKTRRPHINQLVSRECSFVCQGKTTYDSPDDIPCTIILEACRISLLAMVFEASNNLPFQYLVF